MILQMTGDGSGFSRRVNQLEVTQVIIANARSLSQSGASVSTCLINTFSVPKKCFPAVLDLVFDFSLSFCEAVLDRFMFDVTNVKLVCVVCRVVLPWETAVCSLLLFYLSVSVFC